MVKDIASNSGTKKKLLFVTYGGGHVNVVIPVIQKIQQMNNFSFSVIALNTAIPKLLEANIKIKLMNDYIPELPGTDEIYRLGKLLAASYHNHDLPELKLEYSVGYLGVGMYDLIQTYGEKKAWEMFENTGRKSFLPVAVFEKILELEKPDYVITTCSVRFEHAAVLAANRMQIDTIRIYNMWVDANRLTSVKYHFVMNSYSCDQLKKCGVDETKIFITGQPAFDNLLTPLTLEQKEDIFQTLGLSDGEKVILWASDDLDTELYFNEVIKSFMLLNEHGYQFQLIIKAHPNEPLKKFETLLEKAKIHNQNLKLVKEIDVQEIIKISDVVITTISTCGFESFIAGKILISINLSGSSHYDLYKKLGISFHIDQEDQLHRVLKTILTNKNYYENKLAHHEYKVPPDASTRILDTISSFK